MEHVRIGRVLHALDARRVIKLGQTRAEAHKAALGRDGGCRVHHLAQSHKA